MNFKEIETLKTLLLISIISNNSKPDEEPRGQNQPYSGR